MAYIHYIPHDNIRCRWLRWHAWQPVVRGKWDQCARCGRIREAK
jgi:hypothetical protein